MRDHEALGLSAPPEAAAPEAAVPAPPEAAGHAAPAPQPPAPPRPVRRVGTLTMGVALIIVGAAICAGLFAPQIDFLLLFRLSPLVLVALGCEIVFASFREKEMRLKYDFLSMVVCFFLIVGSLGAACVPTVMEYAGPGRSAAETRVERELYDRTWRQLKDDPSVADVTYQVYLNHLRAPSEVHSAADLLAEDSVYPSVEMDGDWADEAAFAAACRSVLEAIRAAGVEPTGVSFFTREKPDGTRDVYRLELSGAYQLDMTDARLADYVERQQYVPQAGCYMNAQELAHWQENSTEELWQSRLEEAEQRAIDAEERAQQAEQDAQERILQMQEEYERILSELQNDAA